MKSVSSDASSSSYFLFTIVVATPNELFELLKHRSAEVIRPHLGFDDLCVIALDGLNRLVEKPYRQSPGRSANSSTLGLCE